MNDHTTSETATRTGAMPSRRRVLKTGLAAAGGLLVSVKLPHARAAAQADASAQMLSVWLRITPDDVVTVMIPSAEMGQGVTTSLSMLVAEELEADWRLIRSEFAPANPAYANPLNHAQATFASNSIRGFFEPLRHAGAAAREMLREAAARRWDVPVAECVAKDGHIRHSSGTSETYGALAESAAMLPVPQDIALKAQDEWRLIGKPTPLLDTPAKVYGSAGYGIDVSLADMLVATIAACPVFGGTLASVEDGPALAIRGVHAVVRLEDAVAVVADGYWSASKGLAALEPVWREGPASDLDTGRMMAILEQGLHEKGAVAEREGDVKAALEQSAEMIEAVYTLPLLAHAPMEPLTATASISADSCEIWAPTQTPGSAQQAVAHVLELEPERVRINTTYLGGGFGRKAETDFVLQAARIAKEVGRPVKLIWSREQDIQHDFYRPAAMARVRAGLSANGTLTAWDVKLVSPSLLSRISPAAVANGVDPTSVEGLVGSPYGLGARQVAYVIKDLGVPVGYWRSVGNSITGFLVECFVDELASAAGQEPLSFRLGLLADKPRHRAVLEKAAAMARWNEPPPSGHFRGLAMHESMGSIVAEVVEISLDGERLRVRRVDCAVDCGIAVNPSTVIAQMEGGIVYGLSAALFGEITLDGGRVEQSNFDNYPVLMLSQMPEINVSIFESGAALGGAGEPSTPPVGPALVNAIFAGTGTRLRSLPISRNGFSVDF